MAVRRRSPQEKKIASYQKDGRNTYGENDKSSRRAVRFRKAWVNRTYRSAVNQELKGVDVERTTDAVAEVQRKKWKKHPDRPLGDVVERKARRRTETDQSPEPKPSQLRDEAKRRRRH